MRGREGRKASVFWRIARYGGRGGGERKLTWRLLIRGRVLNFARFALQTRSTMTESWQAALLLKAPFFLTKFPGKSVSLCSFLFFGDCRNRNTWNSFGQINKSRNSLALTVKYLHCQWQDQVIIPPDDVLALIFRHRRSFHMPLESAVNMSVFLGLEILSRRPRRAIEHAAYCPSNEKSPPGTDKIRLVLIWILYCKTIRNGSSPLYLNSWEVFQHWSGAKSASAIPLPFGPMNYVRHFPFAVADFSLFLRRGTKSPDWGKWKSEVFWSPFPLLYLFAMHSGLRIYSYVLAACSFAVLFSQAAPTDSLERRSSPTQISSAQIASYKPYTHFASAAYCNPSSTYAWSCGGKHLFTWAIACSYLLSSSWLWSERRFYSNRLWRGWYWRPILSVKFWYNKGMKFWYTIVPQGMLVIPQASTLL